MPDTTNTFQKYPIYPVSTNNTCCQFGNNLFSFLLKTFFTESVLKYTSTLKIEKKKR